jgi:hypothetical protein
LIFEFLTGIETLDFGLVTWDFGPRTKSSPPYEGGVAAASADGVVLSFQPRSKTGTLNTKIGTLNTKIGTLNTKIGTIEFVNLLKTQQ